MDVMEMYFWYIGVALLGGFLVSWIAKTRPGATQESTTMAIGVYDIVAGVLMLIVSSVNREKYLPQDEETFYQVLMWLGIVWIAVGLFQVGAVFFKRSVEQEIENKVDDRLREQRRREQPSSEAIPSDSWKCICGRYNTRYISTCACGRNKTDMQKRNGENDAEDC